MPKGELPKLTQESAGRDPASCESDAATFPSPSRAFLYIVGHRNYCQLIFHLMVLPRQLLTSSGFLRHTPTLFYLALHHISWDVHYNATSH